MKTSHPPIRRMIYIDQQIRESKYPNCNTIAKEFEVNRKTIVRDIEFMRDQLGAPIEFDFKNNGYYYTEPDYFLPAIHLQEKDVLAFVVTEKILKQYKNTPYYDEIKTVIRKILQFLPDTIELDEMSKVFSFEQRPTSPIDQHKFDILRKAAQEQLQVKIQYHSQHRNEVTYRIVDPYQILNHHGNWYMVGFCHLRNDVRMFSINRVLSIETMENKFKKPGDFSLEKYLGNSFDLELEGKLYDVELKFSPYQARWIQERQWHKTQKLEHLEDGSLILRMKVRGLNDVKRWLLRYGGEVEVLKPNELRDAIKKEIQKMYTFYF